MCDYIMRAGIPFLFTQTEISLAALEYGKYINAEEKRGYISDHHRDREISSQKHIVTHYRTLD